MKRFLITVLMVVSLFLVFVATAVAGEQVKFEGDKLIFPESSHLEPVNVSILGQLNLVNVPKDKEFVVGKIFEFEFFKLITTTKMANWPGAKRYAIFIEWDKEVRIFYYPTNPKMRDEKPFLDCIVAKCAWSFQKCVPGDEYACEIRGRRTGNSFRMIFQEQKIILEARDGFTARSKVVGEIPVPADQKKP